MDTAPRPGWADRYLQFDRWTHDELRNLLCGLPPHPHDDTPLPDDEPVPTRQAVADAFARNEPHRADADRHIEDAIVAGHLSDARADERLLAKIARHLDGEELARVTRAIAHQQLCTKAGAYAPDEAIRWAAARPGLFPAFPFTADDIPPLPNPSGLVAPPGDPARFGNNLSQLLHERNWAPDELVSRMGGLDRANVQRHLQGKQMPHRKNLLRYAEVFEVTIEQLLA